MSIRCRAAHAGGASQRLTTDYTYDGQGLLDAIEQRHGATVVRSFAYTYDKVGNHDDSVFYSYDAMGQMTEVDDWNVQDFKTTTALEQTRFNAL